MNGTVTMPGLTTVRNGEEQILPGGGCGAQIQPGADDRGADERARLGPSVLDS